VNTENKAMNSDLRIALHRIDNDFLVDLRIFKGEPKQIMEDVISWLKIEVFPYWHACDLYMQWVTDDCFLNGGISTLELLFDMNQ